MPRPRLSSVERRRRAAVKKARWRRQVVAGAPLHTGFINTTTASLNLHNRATQASTLQPRPAGQDLARPESDNPQLAEELEADPYESGLEQHEFPNDDDEDNSQTQYDREAGSVSDLSGDDQAADWVVSDNEIEVVPADDSILGDDEADVFSEDDSHPFDHDLDPSRDRLGSEPVHTLYRPAHESTASSLRLESEETGSEDRSDDEDVSEAGDTSSEEDDARLLAAQLNTPSGPSIDFAVELGRHLIRYQGCGVDQHEQQGVRHQEDDDDEPRHLTLAAYNTMLKQHIPLVWQNPSVLTAAERVTLPTPNWQLAFEGTEAEDNEPMSDQDQEGDVPGIDLGLDDSRPSTSHSLPTTDSPPSRSLSVTDLEPGQERNLPCLCLRCSQVEETSGRVNFDIDSFVGFARSLAVARQGITVNLFPRFYKNFQSSQHLFAVVHYDFGRGERAIKVPLHKVPMIYLGRVIGRDDIEIYVLFERMYHPDKPTNFPGTADGEKHGLIRTWVDSIFLPALFRHLPATSRQHFPHSWEHARLKAQAYRKERRVRVGGEKLANQALSLHYPIHPGSLAAIWADVEQQLTVPANYVYSSAKLFFVRDRKSVV